MNIVEMNGCRCIATVGNVSPGTAVRFLKKFHNGHSPHMEFMVCRAPEGYRPEHDRWGEKTPIVNMRTGLISYVAANREVQLFKAEVAIVPERT